MARRSGATQRARAEKRKEAERAVDPSVRAVSNIVQDLKLVELKGNLVGKATKILPFLYVAFGLALITIPILGYLGLFISGAVSTQIFGPVGLRTRREKHRTDLLKVKERLQRNLQTLGRDKTIYAMGIAAISKHGIEPCSTLQQVDVELVQTLSEDGLFPLGKYRYLAVAISDGEGDVTKLTLNHRDLKEYPWYVEAKMRGISDEDIDALLNDAKQTTLVW